jgi:hypothetical protein
MKVTRVCASEAESVGYSGGAGLVVVVDQNALPDFRSNEEQSFCNDKDYALTRSYVQAVRVAVEPRN